MMMVQLENIARFFGSRLIFKEISFAVEPGSVTLLAGPNGAGKSTLLHIIAGLTAPSAGTISYAREDISIAMLGHQTFLYPELTARENLRFWSGMQGVAATPDELHAALGLVELAPFAEEKCGTFSRGMAQRLSLARVLLAKPDLMLLDEPGTGLDTRSTAMLHREIRTARDRGAAVIWISHALEADRIFADRIIYLERQRIAYLGAASGFTDFTARADGAGSTGAARQMGTGFEDTSRRTERTAKQPASEVGEDGPPC